ncbi:CHAT domain-containing protein [Desarmillaria tabescens]|uniref:CHAT domain-containing protein n=1 Tax=Armillaria tabescens TaxID=1929756 RepID=A0AA39NCA4_ARMTA|nr:CHAT domain-containing protein [Desarmillaria tabescens]KAK0462863.1 CHAT domain-containing protein [Desarmillaria tabescens]
MSQRNSIADTVFKGREILKLCPGDRLERVSHLHNLSVALKTRFGQDGRTEDLEEAIGLAEEAEVLAIAIDHPYLLWFHHCVAASDPSVPIADKLSAYPNASAEERFEVALELANIARVHYTSLGIRAYELAMMLIERVLNVRFTGESQHRFLSRPDVRQLPSHAASLAIQHGALDTAIEMLEQGRGQIWAKLRDYSYPLGDLPAISDELTEAFRNVCVGLMLLSINPSNDVEVTEDRHLKWIQWADTLEKIRQLDGFQDFLLTKPFSSLQAAASDGPVILINIDSHRSDAIILRSEGAPNLVPLSPDLPQILPSIIETLDDVKQNARGSRPWNDDDDGPSSALIKILRVLWEDVCQPVVGHLLATGVAEQSRIWWCPTGVLSNLMDIFVSSYTPTLFALIKARASLHDLSTKGVKLLALGQSNTLSQVKLEFEQLRNVFGDAANLLDGHESKPDVFLTGASFEVWLHFACHGFLNAENPLESYFALHGGSLSVKSIMEGATALHGELAFLAACHSGASDSELAPDEMMSLAGVVQIIGYRCVIATLWAMADVDGPVLTRDFYGYLLQHGIAHADFRKSAIALHFAIKAMRDRGIPIERWSTFIHIGI